MQTFGINVGMLTLASIAFDRLIAVVKPFYYSKNDSKLFFHIILIIAVVGGSFTVGMTFVRVDNSKVNVCSPGAAVSDLSIPISLAWSIFFTMLIFGKFILRIIYFLFYSATE